FMGKPQQVDATFGQFHGERKHVDNAVVVHRFDGGGLGTVDTASMHVESGLTRRIELYGTKGTAIHTPIGSNNLTLSLADAFEDYAAGWQELSVPTPPGPPSLLTELAACISGAKEPDYTLDHDMAVQRTLFAGCGITDGSAMTDVPHSAKSI
ncbi:MAG: Gfo/Idh/MocA family oxidoreductase, partial [Gemmatimonadetes bacterium]|nr:Gfo/Idh/MocA family oxidoreductase [Gemmatimonadota bacterium]